MMRSMFAGVSGMRAHQMMMDVVSDNIANVNTTGFKGSRAVFQDTLSQLIADGSAGGGSAQGGVNPSQVGLGVHVTSIAVNDAQGALQNTGRGLDLAIQGAGLFVVSLDGERMFTRAGSFNIDANNKLVDPTGALVQGWSTLPATGAPSPLVIPGTDPSDPTAELRSYAIATDGTINAVYSNGNGVAVGQLAMATFPNAAGLVRDGDGHLRESPAAGAITYGTPQSGGRGSLTAGSLEMSNVDLAQEFTSLMIAQRGFQANSRVVSSADELLQDLVNLKR
jgi:flagellar hook protein FlgE